MSKKGIAVPDAWDDDWVKAADVRSSPLHPSADDAA